VRLVLHVDPHIGAVMGDADRLQQVIWNLLANGVKFTPKGGRVELRLCKRGSFVEITVEDTGQGITADFLPFLFERFRQAEGGTTRMHGGLGLGLSIVRHILELHGGRIEAHSEGNGQGTTFIAHVPVSPLRPEVMAAALPQTPLPAREAPANRSTGLRGLRMVIVDDEPDARELLASFFEHCEARVMTAESAPAALTLVRETHPDVLVSDIGMPGEDGYSLIRKVRALPPDKGGKTRALALTAYARVEDRARALEAGYDMHLAKPIEPSELLSVITSLVERP
jgi:CheY-like chemotaxis protein